MTITISVVVLVAAAASCSKSSAGPPPAQPNPPAPTATIAGYTRTMCGGLRAVRSLADQLHALAPGLSGDSESRTVLKAKLVTDLEVARKAAILSEQFVAKVDTHGRRDLELYRDSVVTALKRSASDYERWRKLVIGFPTFDRDNWEVSLLSTEGGVIRAGGWVAWQRIARAVAAGSVGKEVRAAATNEPICREVVA